MRPVCRIAHLVEANLAQRQAASVYLRQLAALRVLREHKIGGQKGFLNPAFVDVLKRD